MISIIDFKEDLIISRDDAQKLNLNYSEIIKLGYDHNNKLTSFHRSYEYFIDDCIEKDGKYYENEKKLAEGEAISNYYLYHRYEGDIDYVFVNKENHLVDLIKFAPICKYPFIIKQSVLSEHSEIDNIEMIFQRLEEKATLMENIIERIKDNTFNKKTNVHVGGGLITTYNDLLLKEDICTDVLQTELNNGWRIIAVCVQPDQRRPDYILGRYNPQLEVAEKSSAGR